MPLLAMTRARFAKITVAALSVAAGALVANHAYALSLKVTPIPIVITNGAKSTMVELSNEGSQPLRVQANPFDWNQGVNGEDSLTPSTEILVFPSLVTIPPGQTKKVRIGTQGNYDPTEKSFRVIFAELPSNESSANEQQEVVKVVAHVSVPIFVRAPGSAAALKLESVSVAKDRVKFEVRNTGAAHTVVDKVRLEFKGEGGRVLSSDEVAGWYVLPGKKRPFDVPLSGKLSCAGAKSLVVTALGRENVSTSTTVDHPPCAP